MHHWKKKLCLFIVAANLVAIFPLSVNAKTSKAIKEAVMQKFAPAVFHPGLLTAAEPLEPDKLKNFVVIEKGDLIPAERAFYLIMPSNYDYRGAIIDGDKIKTRSGKPYIYLPKGAVMAIVETLFWSDIVYLKLLSIEKLVSPTNPKKKPTRVTVMLGFKFDKSVLKGEDPAPVISRMEEWVNLFDSYDAAVKSSANRD